MSDPAPSSATPTPASTGWVAPPPVTRRPSPLRSATTRARWLVWLLMANVVVSVIGAAISVWGQTVIAAFERGEATVEDLDQFDSFFATSGIVESVVFVAAAIAWLVWSSRTVDNEDGLGIGPSTISPRLAMGWWFVPFANIVMPYRVHREIHDRYHGGVQAGAGIVLLWWLVYLASAIGTNFVGRFWLAAETFPELQTGLSLWVVTDILTAISAILAIVLVQKIQRRADILAAMQAEAASRPPAPPVVPGDSAAEPTTGPPPTAQPAASTETTVTSTSFPDAGPPPDQPRPST